ncbi:UNVERIFIED_CONTAM: hypothetical protein FKN15_006320 [Acipenser sinensis]
MGPSQDSLLFQSTDAITHIPMKLASLAPQVIQNDLSCHDLIGVLSAPDHSPSAVEWRLNGTRVVSSFAVLQNGNLILTNSDSTMEGNYSCHDKKGQLLRATALRLGYVFFNFQDMSSLTARHASKASETCHQDFFRTNVCTIKNPKNWHSSYVVNITEVNPLGSTFTLSRIQFLDIVKPDPPERVSAEPVHGSPRRLRVYWEYPATWPKESSFPLRFQVQYKPMESRHASKASETCHQDFFRTNVCTIKNPKNWHSSYVVNITEVNPLGSTFTLSRIQFLDIVKPDPPERVSAEPVHGSPRRLRVYWEYPATWPKESSFPLRFQVQYKPMESRSWSVVSFSRSITCGLWSDDKC